MMREHISAIKTQRNFIDLIVIRYPPKKNRVELFSREEAINSGYSPCGNCIVK